MTSATVRRFIETTALVASLLTVVAFSLPDHGPASSIIAEDTPPVQEQDEIEGALMPPPLPTKSGSVKVKALRPDLTSLELGLMIAVPLLSLVAIYLALEYLIPVDYFDKSASEEKLADKSADEENLADKSAEGDEKKPLKPEKCKMYLPGEIAGDYSDHWCETFELVFLISMAGLLGVLLLWTYLTMPALFSDWQFWLGQLAKLGVMISVSVFGGMLCRLYCEHDETGYIMTKSTSWFKVNYTRKIQHLAAYIIPLICNFTPPVKGMSPYMHLCWGDFFTMLGFLVMVKPIRERSTIIMLQFNSLDRPEDRPHNLKWLVAGNIFPGLVLIILFKYIFATVGEAQESLVMIFLLVAGVGDGLAEPVGVMWGKHKYQVGSCGSDRLYTRSLQGSACVFLSTMLFVCFYWWSFVNMTQFWLTMVVLPPLMTFVEATSPHTVDTPAIMGIGGIVLYAIVRWVPQV